MKKKIAFLIQNLEGGGAERVVLNILNNIDLSIFEVKLILIENRGVYLKQLKQREGLQVIGFDNKFKTRHLSFAANYIKALLYLKNNKMDIIFSQYNTGKLLCFFKFLLKKETLIYRETNIPKAENKCRKLYIKLVNRLFYGYGIKKYEKIIVQSQDMMKALFEISSISKDKVHLINNPVDIKSIEKQLLKSDEVESIFKESSNIKLISIGRLSYQKGYDNLINTFSKLKNKNLELKILGEGPDREKLQKLIDNYDLTDKVELIGFKKNPYSYIAQADFFISSSRFEGFPNVVLEACACGVPVIANRYPGGINEIIVSDLNGKIIEISDEKEFFRSLSKEYNPQEIKKDIKNRFSVEIIIKKYQMLFLNKA